MSRFYQTNANLDVWADSEGEMGMIQATKYVVKHREDRRPKYIKSIMKKLGECGINTKDSKDVNNRFSLCTDNYVYAFTCKKYSPSSRHVTLYVKDEDTVTVCGLFMFGQSKVVKAMHDIKNAFIMPNDSRMNVVFDVRDIDECVKFVSNLLRR